MTQDTNIAHHATAQLVVYDTAVPKMLLRPVDSVTTTERDTGDYLLLCNDSVFAPYAIDSLTTYCESMFATNSHGTITNDTQMRGSVQSLDWMFFVIVGLLILMSAYINSIRFSLKDIFTSLFDQRVQGRVERENNVKITSLLPMSGIYVAAVAAAIIQFITIHMSLRLTVPLPLFYAALVGTLILFLLLRGGLIRLVGSIFNDTDSMRLYLTNGHLFYFVGGMVLTPLLLFVFFAGKGSSTALTIALAIVAVILITRFVRGLQLILTNSKSSKLYLFYYLCILEIVPILVMAKILIG